MITVPTVFHAHDTNMCVSGDETEIITANSDDQKSTEGVSLRYIHTPTIEDVLSENYQQPENYNWYFLRISYGRAEQLYKELKDRKEGYLLWLPYQKNVKYQDGMKIETLDPIFKSNLFIYSTREQAFALTRRAPLTGYSYVDFAYDHTIQNEFGRDYVITIRFRDMLQFIKAEQIRHPWAYVVKPEKIHFKEGGLVRVTGGSFEGVEGKVARVFGQTRVIITIKGIVNYATAYISQKYLEPIDAPSSQDIYSPQDTGQTIHEAGNSVRKRLLRREVKMGGYNASEDSSTKKSKHKEK